MTIDTSMVNGGRPGQNSHMKLPRRHHYVPRSYLERWAAGGRVLVRRRDGRAFEADPRNVAVEVGLYDVAGPDGRISSEIEDLLAVIDGAAIDVLRTIDRALVAPATETEDRSKLAAFLALQFTRTRESQERTGFPMRVLAYAGDRELTAELVGEYLNRVHLRGKPMAREAEAAYLFVAQARKEKPLTPEAVLRLSLTSTRELIPLLTDMNWALELDSERRLITSDAPLVLWISPTRENEFRGIGIRNADEIRFPLDPAKQLVLSRRSRAAVSEMSAARVNAVNQQLAAGCHELIVGAPHARQRIERIQLAAHKPVMRFNIAPGLVEEPDGSVRPMGGEILHAYVPRK